MTKAFSDLEKAYSVLNGRARANNFEPCLTRLLDTLNKTWDTAKYAKETLPIFAVTDEYKDHSQIRCKVYIY